MMSNVGSPEVVGSIWNSQERGSPSEDSKSRSTWRADGGHRPSVSRRQDAWEAYEATQEELGEPVDKDCPLTSALRSRYERARADGHRS